MSLVRTPVTFEPRLSLIYLDAEEALVGAGLAKS